MLIAEVRFGQCGEQTSSPEIPHGCPPCARLALDELRHRQVAKIHRARVLEESAERAQEQAFTHSRAAAMLERRLGGDSRTVTDEREAAENWYAQARRLYAEAHALRMGVS